MAILGRLMEALRTEDARACFARIIAEQADGARCGPVHEREPVRPISEP